ncbi:DUF5694 domain-containing protein [Pseudoduganella sp. GCM10020061]|uniref:DUF5694 domain-containing protein n=1 Tax=Pseudoduganella sp. GCM10020061 TaxID=3317345 RepID=UPI00363C5E64
MHISRRRVASTLILGAFAISAGAAAAGPDSPQVRLLRDRPAEERPQLMLVGVPHFANHGLDVLNMQVPDVLEPQRQKEVEAVVAALAAFKPTKVAVEWNAANQAKLDQRYNAYRAGTYQLTRDETDQLALRVAARLGHARVYAVDWNKMPPGEVADFDYEQSAQRDGQQARLAAIRDTSRIKHANAFLRSETVSRWLVHYNQPEQLAKSNQNYFDYTLLGEPGANWVGNWYARNLKIFANLVRVADQPGDRVLVIYGQSHVFPLQQYAEQSGAFKAVSPLPFLK